jgi:hypothetical protein
MYSEAYIGERKILTTYWFRIKEEGGRLGKQNLVIQRHCVKI